MTSGSNTRKRIYIHNCPPVVEPPQSEESILAEFQERQKQLRIEDALNEKSLVEFQRSYMKCTRGKCPELKTNNFKFSSKFIQKKREVNYVSAKRRDKMISRLFITKGRKLRIEVLRNEINELDAKIKVAAGKLHMKKTEDEFQNIEENLRQQEVMIEKIQKAKTEIEHINSQIKRIDRKDMELDLEKEAEVPFAEHLKRANRYLEIYQNRLQLSQQNEGKMLAENRRLFELLSKMLYFRSIFNQRWNKIVHKLKDRRKFLFDMIERTIKAFNQVSDGIENYQNIQNRRNHDFEMDKIEMIKIKRQIDANDIINIFFKQKGKRRPFPSLPALEVKRRRNFKAFYDYRLNFYQNVIQEMMNIQYGPATTSSKEKAQHLELMENEKFGFNQYQKELKQRLKIISSVANADEMKLRENFLNVHLLKEYYENKIKEREQEFRNEVDRTAKLKLECLKLTYDIEKNSTVFYRIGKKIKCNFSPVEKLVRKQNILDKYNCEAYFSVLEMRLHEIIAFVYCRERNNEDIYSEGDKFIVRRIKDPFKPLIKIGNIISIEQYPECEEAAVIAHVNEGETKKILTEKEIYKSVIENIHNLSMENNVNKLSE